MNPYLYVPLQVLCVVTTVAAVLLSVYCLRRWAKFAEFTMLRAFLTGVVGGSALVAAALFAKHVWPATGSDLDCNVALAIVAVVELVVLGALANRAGRRRVKEIIPLENLAAAGREIRRIFAGPEDV